MSCEVRIGASGLDTVEINNSFYKLPNEETFAAWRDATPPGFLFAVKASRFTYLRLHGPGGNYQGSYSEEALRDWAAQIRLWRRRLVENIYVYFDNDQDAFAVRNALELKRLVYD